MRTLQSDADTALATVFVIGIGLVFLLCIGFVSTAMLLLGG